MSFFPQADGEEIPKSSGDESEPSKIDPSRLGSELVTPSGGSFRLKFCKTSKKTEGHCDQRTQDLKRDRKTEALNLTEL